MTHVLLQVMMSDSYFMTCFFFAVPLPSKLITLFTSGGTEIDGEITTVGHEETTSVEVVIDDEGLLTAPEPKRARTDDVIGKTRHQQRAFDKTSFSVL